MCTRRALPAARDEDLHLRCRRSAAVWSWSRTGTDEETGEAQLSILVVDTDVPGLERTLIPVEVGAPEKQFQLFFDDVEVGVDRLVGTEGDGLRQVFFGLNPERITGSSICTGVGRYASAGGVVRVKRSVWDVPIGTHQGIADPLAVAKIELELACLMMMKAGPGVGPRRSRRRRGGRGREHGQVRGRGGRPPLPRCGHPDPRRQRDGLEYGLADLWGLLRLLRIAPVSREMVLNFVAQQSLGLPKSY